MSLPTDKIKKVSLPNGNEYEIIPERLQKNGYEAALPDLTADSTIALTSDLKNQKVKAGSVTFGADDVVNIKGDGIVSVTGNNASGAKDITISASHQSIKTLKTNNSTSLEVSDSEAIADSGTINLHKVSKTGSYNDLLNKPDLANYVAKDDPYLVAVDNTYSYGYGAPVVRDSSNHAISLTPVRLEQHHNLSNSIPIQVGDVWDGRISIKVPDMVIDGEVPQLDALFTELTYSETFGGMPACSLIKAYNETYSTTTMPLFVVNLTAQNLGYVLGTSLPVIGAVPLYATASGSLGGITWVKGYQNISSNFTFNYFPDDGGETITYVYDNYLLEQAYINRVYSASLSSTMDEDGIIALTSDLHTHANKTALDGFAVTSTSVTDGTHTFTQYSHPTYTAASAAAKKIGRDSTGHVVIGDSLTKSDIGLGNVADQTITVTNTSVSDGTNTFNKYTHPTTTAVTAGLYKVGKDSLGHVVLGDSFTIPTDTNQKVKAGSVTFGNNDVVEFVAGNNTTITGNASAKTITIDATNPIVDQDLLAAGFTPVANTYYRHTGSTFIGSKAFEIGDNVELGDKIHINTNKLSEFETFVGNISAAAKQNGVILAGHDIESFISTTKCPLLLFREDTIDLLIVGASLDDLESNTLYSSADLSQYGLNISAGWNNLDRNGDFTITNNVSQVNTAVPCTINGLYTTDSSWNGNIIGIGGRGESFINGVIYFYDGTNYTNIIDSPIIKQDLLATGFTPVNGVYYRHLGNNSTAGAKDPLELNTTPATIYFNTNKSVDDTVALIEAARQNMDGGGSDGITLYPFVSAEAAPDLERPSPGALMLYYVWAPEAIAEVVTDGSTDPVYYLVGLNQSGNIVPIFSNAPLISELYSPTKGWNNSSFEYGVEIKYLQGTDCLDIIAGSTNNFGTVDLTNSSIYHYINSEYIAIDNPSLARVAKSGDYNDLINTPATVDNYYHSPAYVGGLLVGYSSNSSAVGDLYVPTGNTSDSVCAGDDSRLSDARTPTSHSHGNVLNNGTITSAAVTSATGVLVYDSSNKIQRATAANARTIIGAGTYSKPSGGIPDSDIANASAWNNKAAGDHTHGNITNDGKITAAAVTTGAGIVVVDSNGNISKMTDAASARTLIGAGTSNLTLGTSGTTAAYGNHTHSEYVAKTLTSTKGDIIYASAANTPARLGIGTSGQVLKVSPNGIPAWSTDNAGVTSVATNGTGLSGGTITSTGTITLDSSSAGNAAANKVVLRNAAGSIQTEKLAVSSGTTTKATLQYNTNTESLDFIF